MTMVMPVPDPLSFSAIITHLISHSTNQAQLTAPLDHLQFQPRLSVLLESGVLDVVTLRQALTSFLPAGGVIDRLGKGLTEGA